MRVNEVPGRKGPELAFVRESLVGQRLGHDLDEFREIAPVEVVVRRVLGPWPHRLQFRPDLEVLHPARLVAAYQTYAEPPAEHVVHGGDLLGGGEGIVRGGHEAARDDPHGLRMLSEPHRHERRIVRDLEAFDLQVVLGMAETEIPTRLGEPRVVGKFREHAPVQHGILAGHARFELVAASHRAVDEETEFHCGSRLCFGQAISLWGLAQ